MFTYCIHIVEWFERHGKALWLDEQNKISFASNLRIEEILPLNTYNEENSIPIIKKTQYLSKLENWERRKGRWSKALAPNCSQ